MGLAYGRGHGRGKPSKPPKGKPTPSPIQPIPPPIDNTMADSCFGGICGTNPVTKQVRRTKVRFVTRGVQGIRRYR